MRSAEALGDRFRSTISPEKLRSRTFWMAVRGVERSLLRHSSSPAEAAGLRYAIESTRDAFLGRGPVAWASQLVPCELVHGTGTIPFFPEIAAAAITMAGLNERFLERAAAEGFSNDLCSFHRIALGAALEGFLPRPDIILSTTRLCDSAPLSFSRLSDFYGVENVSIDVPARAPSADAVVTLAGQLEQAAARLEAVSRPSGREAAGRLAAAIELSNEARRYGLEVEELRRSSPCPMDGWVALGYLAVLTAMPGTRGGADFYRLLARQLRDNGTSMAPGRQRHRLLWMHLKPYFPTGIPALLEEKGAVIVCEEYNRMFWPELDPERPFDSLAEKILSHPSGGPASSRASRMVELALSYNVDGAVHFSHRGCRQSTGCARQVRDELARAGVRTLILDGECLDSREHNEGQVRTRLEAFLESLDTAPGTRDASRPLKC